MEEPQPHDSQNQINEPSDYRYITKALRACKERTREHREWNLHEWIHAKSLVKSRTIAQESSERSLEEQSKYQVFVAEKTTQRVIKILLQGGSEK